MRYALIENTGYLPYYNIALEKYLFDHCREDEILLYLWVNDPCVIAGCHQNVLLEWDNNFLKKEGIYPVRRLTGGGCVYQDRGNLNYSFISRLEHKAVEKWLNIILNAVNRFGLTADLSGRNDLTAGGRKFGGTAWLEEDDKILFHGTLMVDVDIARMERSLTPSFLKFEGKAIASVRSRVVNLRECSPKLQSEALAAAIVSSFTEEYGQPECLKMEQKAELEAEAARLAAPEWIYNKNASGNILLEYKRQGELVQLNLTVRENTITGAEIFTDSVDALPLARLKERLMGAKYTESDFTAILDEVLGRRDSLFPQQP